jgi:hypothetical protein
VVVDELAAVSLSVPSSGNGMTDAISSSAAITHFVVAHNSSRILPLSALLAREYRVAIAFVTPAAGPSSVP